MKNKSRAILFIDNQIVLIKREKDNQVYYVFPGGSIELGETSEEACARELQEELGIEVSVDKLLFEFYDYVNNIKEFFYTCTLLSGRLGGGEDKKFMEGTKESFGYSIFLTKKDNIKNINLLPLTIRDKVLTI